MIGGDAAGMSAASQAKRMRPDLDVVAFERSGHVSYSACGMPYLVEGLIADPDDLVVRSPEEFTAKGISTFVRHEVEQIDLKDGKVTVHDLESGGTRDEPFDILLVATGSVARKLDIPGVDLDGVLTLRDLDSGIAMVDAIEDSPKSAVVIGGGYIGVEVAEAFTARGIKTTVIEAAPQPMGTFDAEMGQMVADILRGAGVDLLLDEPVQTIEGSEGRCRAVISQGRRIDADLVVLAVGTRPNSDLAEQAGLRIGETGAVWVDDHMRTSHAGIWAAGDCAEQTSLVTGRPVSFHLGTIANKMGRIAGTNIAGGDLAFPGVLGTALSRFRETEFARTGIGEAQAAEAGISCVSIVSRSRTKASYFPGSQPMSTKLIVENPSGRLLGAQIVGASGAGKRIDIFAVALWNRMKVSDMVWMDLSYHPSVSGVWDPALIAIRKAAEALGA